jgi:hypothetical protein
MIRLPINATEVIAAIQGELNSIPEKFPYRVTSVEREGRMLVVGLAKATHNSPLIDESLEGTNAWWANPEKGYARVRAVDVETDQIVLNEKSGGDPVKGEMIFLYPPRFLDPLKEAWQSEIWVAQINGCLEAAFACRQAAPPIASLDAFPWLRRGQRDAQSLHQWPLSFLWGPPGTGKTKTLGAVIASLITADPMIRVLLVSTTNTATDQALISVDDALKEMSNGEVTKNRALCKRVGTHFLSDHYDGRSHLLPQRDEVLLRELKEHQKRYPHQGDVVTLAWWNEENERIRTRLRSETMQLIAASRLAAMTTTRACFDLKGLKELPRFDFLVVDEASQVSLAHVLPLIPLAKRMIFAGDPMQLSPICQRDLPSVRKWLGASAFEMKDQVAKEAICFLSEQSRMSGAINDLVSGMFYEERLEVCSKASESEDWQNHRNVSCNEDERVQVIPVTKDGYYTQQYEGTVRHASAEKIVQIAKDLESRGVADSDVQVLTPFRAQRRLIRRLFKDQDIRIPVSTVHRSQGSEKKVIIFDPVDGGSEFLNLEEGHRLINVAFSRAKAQLYVLLSSGDAQNLKLSRLATPALLLPLFCELNIAMEHNEELVGKTFGYMGMKLRGKRIADGRAIRASVNGGDEKQFGLEFMREKCGDFNHCPNGFTPQQESNSRCCFPT